MSRFIHSDGVTEALFGLLVAQVVGYWAPWEAWFPAGVAGLLLLEAIHDRTTR